MKASTRTYFRHALLAGLIVATLSGCNKSATPANPASKQVSDADVTLKVNSALRQNADLKQFAISVVTTKGDVRLTGEVESATQHELAVKIARETEGVHSIHDELIVKQ